MNKQLSKKTVIEYVIFGLAMTKYHDDEKYYTNEDLLKELSIEHDIPNNTDTIQLIKQVKGEIDAVKITEIIEKYKAHDSFERVFEIIADDMIY